LDLWADDPVEDAPTIEVEAMRVGPARAPVDWRGEEPTLTPRHGTEAAMVGLRTLPIVGRDAERERLWALLHEVGRTGEPRMIRIDGPAGSGVDRLTSWVCERAIETGAAYVAEADAALEDLLGRDRPTVWVDGSPTALGLAGTLGRAPVLLVLRRGSHEGSTVETMTLGPVPLPALRLLIHHVVTADETTEQRVVEAAGGLPGFAVELLQHWIRVGALATVGGRYVLTGPHPPLPPSWAELRTEAVDRFVEGDDGLRAGLELIARWSPPNVQLDAVEAALRWLATRGVAAPREGWVRDACAAGLLVRDGGIVRCSSPGVVAAVVDHPDARARRDLAFEAIANTATDPLARSRAWVACGDLRRATEGLYIGYELVGLLRRLGTPANDPLFAECLLGEASTLFVRGDGDRMEAVLDELGDDLPRHLRAWALAQRADLANLRSRPDLAGALVDAALALDPDQVDVRVAWARHQSVVARDRAALERILEWASDGPGRGLFLRLASRTAAVLGDKRLALELLDRSDAIEPGNPHALTMRGMLAASLGEDERALAALEAAARVHRDQGNVFGVLVTLRWRIDVLLDAAREDEAWVLLDQADLIESRFGSSQAMLDLFRAERSGDRPGGAELEACLVQIAGESSTQDHSPRPLVSWAQAVGDRDLLERALDHAIAVDTRLGHPRLARWLALREALSDSLPDRP
ncbi:MAG: hypothetical protein KC621_27815, partial [Myxococcales bacterium]|nr:hypothetical protein [Myxococcales bacterium]